MTPAALAPAATAMLLGLLLYRRFRRLFGRQRVQPKRMRLRVALLGFVGALLLLGGMRHTDIALAAIAGLAGGAALASLGLRLTRFERTPQGQFYTPHGGIGLALSVLLLGRLAYRFYVVYPALQANRSAAADPFSGVAASPLTAAMLALLIAYYIAYTIGVLIRSGKDRGKPAADTPDQAASPPSGP